MYGLPSSNTTSTEGNPSTCQPPIAASLKEDDFEAFGASWSSALFDSSASPDAAGAITCNSIKRSSTTGTGSSSSQEESFSAMKASISSHPLYPKLLDAYIDCQKV